MQAAKASEGIACALQKYLVRVRAPSPRGVLFSSRSSEAPPVSVAREIGMRANDLGTASARVETEGFRNTEKDEEDSGLVVGGWEYLERHSVAN
jgi:hypothetical protein